ncbi:MAG: hypothetical protein FJ295_12345 [Planctomycetes bacterium]|nr:hypothetical protein [Planctomycetota bacterium]
MGIVLRAFDTKLHRVVALKVMSPQLASFPLARQRFVREGHSVAAVCHEHVVTIHAVAEEAGLPYLVMQYVSGKNLQERLDQSGPLKTAEILRIGLQAAAGLAAEVAFVQAQRHARAARNETRKVEELLDRVVALRQKQVEFAKRSSDVGDARPSEVLEAERLLSEAGLELQQVKNAKPSANDGTSTTVLSQAMQAWPGYAWRPAATSRCEANRPGRSMPIARSRTSPGNAGGPR